MHRNKKERGENVFYRSLIEEFLGGVILSYVNLSGIVIAPWSLPITVSMHLVMSFALLERTLFD